MIKKIIWTVIFIIPLGVGFANVSSDVINNLFNTSNIIGNWQDWFTNEGYGLISNIQNEGTTWWQWTQMVFMLIWALIWTAPLWYAWKGTFIIGWVPLLGFALRFALLGILLFAPSFLIWLQNLGVGSSDWATTAEPYMASALIILALIGLWIKS